MNEACGDWAENLSAYCDGELAVAESSRLESHLQECASCREDMAKIRKLKQWLSDSGAVPGGDAELAERIWSEIRPRLPIKPSPP